MAKPHTKMVPVAVFDISSSSVAGAHVLIPKKNDTTGKVSILASSRLLSKPKEDLTIERFVDGTIEQLEKTIALLKKADNHTPEHIQILLASPWFISQTRSISYNKSSAFVCTQKLVDSLIEKEIAYIIEHDMERFGAMGKDGIIIERQISQIKLNGYSTTEPFGKKIESLELFLVVTVAPKSIIERFKAVFQKDYAKAVIKFTTSPYATFVVSRDFLSAPNESLIIDIGEEITDIACVKNELFLYQYSFPMGLFELYRALASKNNISLSETHALIESFKLAKLSAPMTSSVQKILEDFGAAWGRSFQETLNLGQNSIKLPEISYIISDSRFDSLFVDVLKQDLFLQHVAGNPTYTAIVITQDSLSLYVTSLDVGAIDVTIIVASLFASRML